MTPIECIISEIGGQVTDRQDVLERLRAKYGTEALETAINVRNQIRRKIQDRLWHDQQSLANKELDSLVMSVIDADYSQFNRTALASITEYMAWYSWHEGFSK